MTRYSFMASRMWNCKSIKSISNSKEVLHERDD